MNQKDFQKRDAIVFGKVIDWGKRESPPGVCERFEGLDAEGINELLALGFMRLSQTMNATPTVESFLEFANETKQKGFTFKFEGFAFGLRFERDREVSLEGIYHQGYYPPEIGLAFAKFASAYEPDELLIEEKFLRAWWD
ncbi:MAG: hypothetical protein M3367_17295 [Acidobacteriota bacterium]|nr:hypothetical protein [Acidobacteriota bacterium]